MASYYLSKLLGIGKGGVLRVLGALLLGLVLPSGVQAASYAFVALGPGGKAVARAIIPAGGSCPELIADGEAYLMTPRIDDGRFAVAACEVPLPTGVHSASIDGQALPLPAARYARIAVVGDTGCRKKGFISQDCETDWPWPAIAGAIARLKPDLVLHVGDYHYRESCLLGHCGPVGYGWDTWKADFFDPSRPLFAAAPWVFVRGNHEDCGRAWEGWRRLLSPYAWRPCESPREAVSEPAYTLPLDPVLSLTVADNASFPDKDEATPLAAGLTGVCQSMGGVLAMHKPILAGTATGAACSLSHAAGPVLSGHIHLFAAWQAGEAAQFVVGNSGTALDKGFGPETLGPWLRRSWGFMMLEPESGRATLYDRNGRAELSCSTGIPLRCRPLP